ncbi:MULTISPECIES: hypothetical protein [Enterobacter]|uniref:Uncharacterized protein n=1 Tax=Enterobacter cloacae TaxID=550 RepID=A0A6S5JS77_ENTCL|nr:MULTISPECIES: hypothetical protein [Enterobacter]MCU2368467.1 hypothetical protein [Enterobacter hormaechei subsp. xiangfangensis]HAS0830258.1 hypothetical protein [Enterobacter cloacae subsp. cloacae]HAT7509172.1 hypothetical protein [Enterobacter asburiae]AIE62235.1 hypothetical protein ECNIH2_02325 [Enterobacter cloacae ECNIH2]AKK77029.1 hypothetical protein ABY62_10330 [Enterobacter hormaechei]
MKLNLFPVAIVIIAGLSVALVKSCSDASGLQSDNDVLRSDNTLQGQVIATQAFNFNRFNQVAEHANRLNSLIDTSTEETVIEYREILRREKTCDLPVPADVAGGLLEYAHRLRASAMHTDTNRPYAADDRSAAASSMTYCQAVLWIKPLLAVIEKGNNNFAGIREIEQTRASQ